MSRSTSRPPQTGRDLVTSTGDPQAGPIGAGAARAWLRAGEVAVLASIVLLLLMQLVTNTWFPPPISISQYGIGGWGWLFTLWAISLAVAPSSLLRALEVAGRRRNLLGWVLIGLGGTGAVVMAFVRTQAGGDQVTWNAKVHMVASIMASSLIPLGILAVLWTLGGRWRVIGSVEVAVIAAAFFLLLFAAGGADNTGLGQARSWAFWQAVAAVFCEALLVTMALAVRPALRPAAGVPGPPHG